MRLIFAPPLGTYVPSTMDFPQLNGDKGIVHSSSGFGFSNPYELQGTGRSGRTSDQSINNQFGFII